MKQTLEGKVVLITGASGGIGEALARAFSLAGSHVALAARNVKKLNVIAAGLKNCAVIPTDLTDEQQAIHMIDETVKHFGRIDILINNAACIIVSPVSEVSSADLNKAFCTNVTSPLAAIQRSLTYMKQQGRGLIINIGSPGFMMGIPFYTPYVSSKAAFSALTRTMQAELDDDYIRICEYFPGYIKTDSRPESRIGEVSQDFLMEEKSNFLNSLFTKPQHPDTVARQIIKLALHPRVLTYSSFTVRLGALLALFSNFRLNLAKKMALNARKKMEITNQ